MSDIRRIDPRRPFRITPAGLKRIVLGATGPVDAQAAGADNDELFAWTGHRNAPIAIYGDEPPRTTWRELLWLAERIEPDRFEHVARWDPAEEWIEMWLRAEVAQSVLVRGLDLTVEFAVGEAMRTEISAKFTRDRVAAELGAAGLDLEAWWTDPAGDFALSLSRSG